MAVQHDFYITNGQTGANGRMRPRRYSRVFRENLERISNESREHGKAGSFVSVRSAQRRPLVADMSQIEDSPAGVNNFVLVVATVNGSSSQTANTCLLRACFKMGIPVSGKN